MFATSPSTTTDGSATFQKLEGQERTIANHDQELTNESSLGNPAEPPTHHIEPEGYGISL
jgi:hypothetical protein